MCPPPEIFSVPKTDGEDLRVGGSERREGSTWTKWLALTPKVHQILCLSGKLVKQDWQGKMNKSQQLVSI
jgi:hypothetical protein